MKKAFLALLLISMVGSGLAASAVISPNTPGVIELNSSNNYEVTKTFDGSASSPDSASYSWSWEEAGVTKSGPEANFTFGTDDFETNTIKLVVTSQNDSESTNVTQTVRDVPRINKATVSKSKVNLSKSNGDVDLNVSADDSFNNNLTYEWMVDGTKEKTGQNVTYTFSSTGNYPVSVKVTDGSGLSKTKQAGTVNVVKETTTDEEDTEETQNLPPTTPPPPPENQTDNVTDNKTDNKPENVPKGPQRAKAQMSNGVATVTIQKENGTRDISVSVAPRSDKATVKNIRISSNTTGEVKVSVTDLGRERPETLPEAAAEEAVYNYQEINTTVNDTEIDAAQVDFSVNQSWIEERNTTRDNVVMKRFDNGNWTSLETRYINTTGNQLNFEASSTGFSYYAVALESETDGETDETPEQPATEEAGNQGIMYAVIVVVLLLAAVILYLKREEIQQYLQ